MRSIRSGRPGPTGPTRRRARSGLRRLGVALAGGALAATAWAVVPAGGPPAGAGLIWNVTVGAPDTVTGPTVTVTGRATLLLGQVRSVRVRLVPRVELPAACGSPEGTGPVVGGTYAVDISPECNGPYRAEVVASGTDLLGGSVSSGRPAVRDLSVADPGPAPAPPVATVGGEGIDLSWAAASDPDIVAWTLLADIGGQRSLPAGTTRAVVPAPAGEHGFRLVARRWGADGPGGAEVTSPASDATAVQVERLSLDPPARPHEPVTAGSDPQAGGADREAIDAGAGSHAPGSGSSLAVPRRRGPLDRGATRGLPSGGSSRPPAAAPGEAGFADELPYGDRDRDAEAGEIDDAEPAGEQAAAGPPPSARVVRSTERTSPGLVVPFTLALGLGSAAIWLWSTLRRSRRVVEG